MHNPTSFLAVLFLVGVVQADDSDKPWQIHGQVVDEQGTPVEEFQAATFWLSNGNWWDEAGELTEEASAGKLWKNEGVLAADPRVTSKQLSEGRINLTVTGQPRAAVFAVDKRHERGGIVLVEQDSASTPVTITLAPLVRVTAEVYCSEAGRTPDWSNVVVFPVDDDSDYQNLTMCGSFRGKASFLLPPGTYDLKVYSNSPNARMHAPNGQQGIRVEIPHGRSAFNLGVLNVTLPRDKDGIARDYSQFYGKEPPELAITDARGVAKDVKLADFRGKWVLLDFWSVWCGPCVYNSLPKLTKLYEEHSADRDRFEILAICNTEKEEARTIDAFDALAAPLVENIWDGKQLPFPVLVDGEGRTSDVYGIVEWPTILLIDPEGHLVKNGDVATLVEMLNDESH